MDYTHQPLDSATDGEYNEKNDENTEAGKKPSYIVTGLLTPLNPVEYWKDFARGADDLRRGRSDNKDADLKKSDIYFHCRANCEASKRGPGGQDAARSLSWLREVYQSHIKEKKQTPDERKEDEAANAQGQRAGRDNPDVDCYKACADLIPPSGIPRRYLPPHADPKHIYQPKD